MALKTYNACIEHVDVGFSSLWNDIDVAKYNLDGTEVKRYKVPLVMAGKENFVARLKGDPDFSRNIEIALPRMAWEKLPMTIDLKRKLNSAQQQFFCVNGKTYAAYGTVPYKFNYNLYIYVRNMDDGNQILEHILPLFTPDYTIRINLIPEIGLIKDLPIVLNYTGYENTYEGLATDAGVRDLLWTLSFSVLGYMYGQIREVGRINHVIQNIYTPHHGGTTLTVSGINGTFKENETVYTGYGLNKAIGKGTILDISNNVFTLTDITGSFKANSTLKGFSSMAFGNIDTIVDGWDLSVKIDTYTNPANTNFIDPYEVIETISEFPDIT